MRKLVSLVLALALILCMTTTAFANGTAVTFASDVTRVYDGYQLLELSVSLKTGDHHPATCDNTNHGDDCYNYSYTVNEDYLDILRAEAFAHASNTVWGDTFPTTADDVTEQQILDYLAEQTSRSDNSMGTLYQVAERVYAQIITQGIDPNANDISDTATIGQGYWIFVDDTNLEGEYMANSLLIVDTKGQNQLTITPKTALPEVEKKVKDIDDTEGAQIINRPWHDSADHDIGDTVPFKLTGTLPSNIMYYSSYEITFHDTLSAGLTLNDTITLNPNVENDARPFAVYMYSSKTTADADNDMNGGTEVTNYFTWNTNPADGCSFEVSSDGSIFQIPGITASSVFVVYYEATLNTSAVPGNTGNPNKVVLEFSNDPHGDSTGKTPEDVVTVFTYQLDIDKIDEHGHDLAGANFTLYKFNPASGNYDIEVPMADTWTETTTSFSWKGLDDGEYKLVETKVPDGFNEMEPIEFTIYAVHDTVSDDPELTLLDGDTVLGQGNLDTGIIYKEIINQTGTVLPETGAQGTMMLIGGGTMLVMLAAIFMVTRKKMSIYED